MRLTEAYKTGNLEVKRLAQQGDNTNTIDPPLGCKRGAYRNSQIPHRKWS